MAEQGRQVEARSDYRVWVYGLIAATLLMIVLGVWGAATTQGLVQPWMGVGLLLALALATITGVSKTSSA